ncbi:MAG: hypothetical protein M1133_08730 [Armatimonadetes bacterium]|nr:hypothetical protein [Armatimonadota bacterium]
MERLSREKTVKRPGGGMKDRPLCERCGRPVSVGIDDYLDDEILCTSCTSEVKASKYDQYDYEM